MLGVVVVVVVAVLDIVVIATGDVGILIRIDLFSVGHYAAYFCKHPSER